MRDFARHLAFGVTMAGLVLAATVVAMLLAPQGGIVGLLLGA